MDQKEILLAAEQGNVDAMVHMAEYYLHLNVEEALKWAQMAAKEQHTYGAYLTAICKRVQSRTACAFNENTAMRELLGFYTWSRQALMLYWSDAKGSEKLNESQLLSLCEEAAFERANRLYLDGDLKGAIAILKTENSYRNSLLIGLCLIDYYRENEDSIEEDLLEACAYLSEIRQVQSREQCREFHVEQLYTNCALRFSEIQRKGIWPLGAKPSPRSAVETLRSVRCVIKNRTFLEMLNKEISRYEKILFGRYVYIG